MTIPSIDQKSPDSSSGREAELELLVHKLQAQLTKALADNIALREAAKTGK